MGPPPPSGQKDPAIGIVTIVSAAVVTFLVLVILAAVAVRICTANRRNGAGAADDEHGRYVQIEQDLP